MLSRWRRGLVAPVFYALLLVVVGAGCFQTEREGAAEGKKGISWGARLTLPSEASGADAAGNGRRAVPRAAEAASGDLCEMCRKPLVARWEVVVTDLATRQRHFYRCVHCAIVAMSRQFLQARAELTSAVQRRTITLLRDGDQWRSKPGTAVLLILPEENGECIARHQTFADPEEFQAYLRDHPDLAAHKPQSYDLSDVDAIIRTGYGSGP